MSLRRRGSSAVTGVDGVGSRAWTCGALVAAIVLAGVLAIGSSPSAADSYGYPDPGYVYDSADHWYCFHPSFSENQLFVHSALSYLDSTTNLYDVYTATCGSSTDAVFIEGYADGALGWAPCAAWVSTVNHICDQVWVVIDVDLHWEATATCAGDATELLDNLQVSIRHELGHTVGLSHALQDFLPCGPPNPLADDAMISDWLTGSAFPYVDYNGHHIGHINCKCSNP